jgi:transcriptional regulator with XRE-family HTH domain
VGRVANYRNKINGLLDGLEQKFNGLWEEDDLGNIGIPYDKEDDKFRYEYSLKELEKVIRLLDALKSVGVDEGPGFCNKISEATGYSRNRVSDMLSGNVSLNPRFIKAICVAFGTSDEYISDNKGQKALTPIVSDSYAMKEAIRILSSMSEPERFRAVAMLMEMLQQE